MSHFFPSHTRLGKVERKIELSQKRASARASEEYALQRKIQRDMFEDRATIEGPMFNQLAADREVGETEPKTEA